MQTSLFIIILYFIFLVVFSFFVWKKSNTQDYLINSRNTGFMKLLFSHIAIFLGAWSLAMFISWWYKTGLTLFAVFVIGYSIWIFIFSKLIPWIWKEWKEKKYYNLVSFFDSSTNKLAVKALAIWHLFSILIWIVVQISVFSLIFSYGFQLDPTLSMVISTLVVVLYNFLGGMKFMILSDYFQTILILLFIMIFIWYMFYNWADLIDPSIVDMEYLFKTDWNIIEMVSMFLISIALPLGSASYWQRVLSAKSISVAQKSYFVSLFFIFLVVGVLTCIWLFLWDYWAIDTVLATFMSYSWWIFGIIVVALLSMVMSSVDSLINSWTTILWNLVDKDINKSKLINIKLISLAFWLFSLAIWLFFFEIINLTLFASWFSILFALLVIIPYRKYKKLQNKSI